MIFFYLMMAWAAVIPLVWALYDRVYFNAGTEYTADQLRREGRLRNVVWLGGIGFFAVLGLLSVWRVLP
jgi:hypothetical protein